MAESVSTRPGARVAIVEPTSLLGRDVKSALEEKAFPIARLELFHTQGTTGTLTRDDEEALYVAPLVADSLDDCDVAFFCGKPEQTESFLKTRTGSCLVIDLSGVRTGGPFVIPFEDSETTALPAGDVYLTIDPAAYVIAEAIRALDALQAVQGATVAIDRPVSELGREALDELFAQSIALAGFKPVPQEFLGTRAAFNFYHPPDTSSYEQRVIEDVRRGLGRPLPLVLLSARAGVFHGHHIRIEARFASAAPTAEAIRASLFATRAFAEVDAENLSGPVESAGRDETLVLRVTSDGSSAVLGLASDVFRYPGALMAVRLAEDALVERSVLPARQSS
ncbi:MAG: hypothetical protein ABIT01_11550 [Thermoanaerobaculia bacterium]